MIFSSCFKRDLPRHKEKPDGRWRKQQMKEKSARPQVHFSFFVFTINGHLVLRDVENQRESKCGKDVPEAVPAKIYLPQRGRHNIFSLTFGFLFVFSHGLFFSFIKNRCCPTSKYYFLSKWDILFFTKESPWKGSPKEAISCWD